MIFPLPKPGMKIVGKDSNMKNYAAIIVGYEKDRWINEVDVLILDLDGFTTGLSYRELLNRFVITNENVWEK